VRFAVMHRSRSSELDHRLYQQSAKRGKHLSNLQHLAIVPKIELVLELELVLGSFSNKRTRLPRASPPPLRGNGCMVQEATVDRGTWMR
jgi:hypothetical protein